MYQPTLKEVKKYAEEYKNLPIAGVLYADLYTPVQVMRILRKVSRHCYIFESMEDTGNRGRYTILGYDPKLEISCKDGTVRIRSGTEIKIENADPQLYIQNILEENKTPLLENFPPFTGGLAGYFSYDYIQYGEKGLHLDAPDKGGFQDVDLMLFDKVIVFDHLKQKIFLIANMKLDHPEENYGKAKREIHDMAALLKEGREADIPPLTLQTAFKPLFEEKEYCSMVEKAKHYIREGDIFQAVLSNRLTAKAEGSLFDTYRVLRTTNPSPYMFYLSSDDLEVAGASPETLVKLQKGRITTFPLAGTKPRGASEEEDIRLEAELLSDEKELAEHNMLVDLGRNDIGKVSRFGTVCVEKYREIVKFSHVMHIGSAVSGELNKNKTALDAVKAVLPAGTLSGAPKRRACEIIHELEQDKRGIYGGAIGYIDFTGNMDICIAIRLVYKKNGSIVIRSGAGIVADSVPEQEYRECIRKAQAVVDAVQKAEGGLENDLIN